jgi:Pyruvate/2-oxoacid:ferredoxin oxidoreductase gamma subunit
VNTAILGGVVKILKLAKLESLLQSIKEGVPLKPEDNANTAKEAYNMVKTKE